MLFDNLVGHSVYRGVDWQADKAYEYVLAGNGLFKRAHSPLLQVCVPIFHHPIAGLPMLKPEITVHPARVAGDLLYYILRDACQAAAYGREKLYHIELIQRHDGPAWNVIAPVQKTSSVQIVYGVTGSTSLVCELHSHHTMPAFFSGMDTRDEQGFRFYAVIGRLFEQPEIAVRLGIYGDFIPVPATILFTNCGPFTDRMGSHADGD